jgi:hypothetical protein
VGEVVRLPGGTATLQGLPPTPSWTTLISLGSTRRVYRASVASLVAELGPATAVGDLAGQRLGGWFSSRHRAAAPATSFGGAGRTVRPRVLRGRLDAMAVPSAALL